MPRRTYRRARRGLVRLGVNIDHIATLREVRKASYPSVIDAAIASKRGGADQITIHLREDRRHIQDHDLKNLMAWGGLPINLEMGLTNEMIEIAIRAKPFSVTLVPERREEMTTESGLNLSKVITRKNSILKLKRKCRVYAFIDPEIEQVKFSAELQFDGIEFHTGSFARLFDERASLAGKRRLSEEIGRLVKAAKLADDLGLEVKAGHGLTLENVGRLKRMPKLIELNIGHSIVARAVFVGLEHAVLEMKKAVN